MPDELRARVEHLERAFGRLLELVDGQAEWSHRKRLHKLETDDSAARLAGQALDAYRHERDKRTTRLREWGGFVLAAAAVVFTVGNSSGWF